MLVKGEHATVALLTSMVGIGKGVATVSASGTEAMGPAML